MKLLYFLDFIHYKQTGRSVTNLEYKAWKRGPVPTTLYKEIEPNNTPSDMEEYLTTENEEFVNQDGHCLKIYPRKEFNQSVFSKRELKILEQVAFIFKDYKAKEMTETSHFRNQPWHRTIVEKGEGEFIDYRLALDSDQDSLEIDELIELKNLDKEVKQIFE